MIGCEVYVADDRPRAGEGLRAPDAAGRDERGLREPDQALLARLPRGLLLQAAGRLGAARAPRERAGRALRLPLGPGLQGARGEPAEGRRAPTSTGSPRSSAATRRYVEMQNAGLDVAAADQPAARELAEERRPAARRHRRRPLPAARGRARARGAALHPVGRLAEEPEPLEVRHRPVLLQDAGRDGARLRRGHEDAVRRTLEVAERCNVELELGRILLPQFPTPDGPRRLRLPRRALRAGPRAAATRRVTPELRSGSSSSSRRSRRWASPTTS